jgi:hypothetical protein
MEEALVILQSTHRLRDACFPLDQACRMFDHPRVQQIALTSALAIHDWSRNSHFYAIAVCKSSLDWPGRRRS